MSSTLTVPLTAKLNMSVTRVPNAVNNNNNMHESRAPDTAAAVPEGVLSVLQGTRFTILVQSPTLDLIMGMWMH